MGRTPRARPTPLSDKLLRIRDRLGLDPERMLERLDPQGAELSLKLISELESGRREPSADVLLRYARAAGVPLEILVDDRLSLPVMLPGYGAPKVGECPYCHSTERQVKDGRRRRTGVQKYLCQSCRRRYTPEPLHRGYPEGLRREALRLYQEGLNFRRISQTLGVTHQTVINWVYRLYAHRPVARREETATPGTNLTEREPA